MKARRLMGTLVLVLALAMGIVGTAAPQSEAASRKKFTMVKGEKRKLSVLFIGSLKSVKSTKKSVVSVKKSGSRYITLKAKKAGKATIKVKGQYGYGNYVITVKKKKLSCVYKGFRDNTYSGYAYYEITNKCGDYLSSATMTYDILDANNNVLKTASDMTIYSLVPNAKYYASVYISGDLLTQGATAIRVKSYSIKHDMLLNYKNYTKKVTVKYNKSTGAVTFKNKTKKNISAKADIVFYDDMGNIVDVQTVSSYMTSKGKDTKTVTTSKEFSTAKVFKKAYA